MITANRVIYLKITIMSLMNKHLNLRQCDQNHRTDQDILQHRLHHRLERPLDRLLVRLLHHFNLNQVHHRHHL